MSAAMDLNHPESRKTRKLHSFATAPTNSSRLPFHSSRSTTLVLLHTFPSKSAFRASDFIAANTGAAWLAGPVDQVAVLVKHFRLPPGKGAARQPEASLARVRQRHA
jgi:hypothetical protein